MQKSNIVMLESLNKIVQSESPERRPAVAPPMLPSIEKSGVVKVMSRVHPLVSPLKRPNRYVPEEILPPHRLSIQVSKVFHT
jgi:hypothetical protein